MPNFLKACTPVLLALTLLCAPMPVLAQTAAGNPADQEYMAAMEKMNKEMMAAKDPDAAKAFAKKMAVHHQGAIDMSKTVLKHTQDKEIRRMAQKMINEQQKEIKKLQSWIARHGG